MVFFRSALYIRFPVRNADSLLPVQKHRVEKTRCSSPPRSFFYAWGEPFYIFLLLLSSLVNYVAGLLIENHRAHGKAIVAAALVFDLGMLAVFKYAGFFVENINALFGVSIPVPDIVMPIGISFFTFQIISLCHRLPLGEGAGAA